LRDSRDVCGEAQPECGERRLHKFRSGRMTQVEYASDLSQVPRQPAGEFGTAHALLACLGGGGIHPMPAGYDVLTPLWFQAIRSIETGTGEINKPK
jgi:hypothetical protein